MTLLPCLPKCDFVPIRSSGSPPRPLLLLHGCCILLYPFQPCLEGNPVALDCGRYVLVNRIWSPQDLEWVSGLCLQNHTGHGLHEDEGLSVPGWMERSETTGLLLNWCDTTVHIHLTRYPVCLGGNEDKPWLWLFSQGLKFFIFIFTLREAHLDGNHGSAGLIAYSIDIFCKMKVLSTKIL